MKDLIERAKARAAELDYEASERDRNDPAKSELRADACLIRDLASAVEAKKFALDGWQDAENRVADIERALRAISEAKNVHPLWAESRFKRIADSALNGEPWE